MNVVNALVNPTESVQHWGKKHLLPVTDVEEHVTKQTVLFATAARKI